MHAPSPTLSPLSPTASGYLGVLPSDTYNPTRAYGWLSWGSGFNHSNPSGTSDPLRQDGIMGTSNTFRVNVDLTRPSYTVTVYLGDYTTAHSNVQIALEGILRETVSTLAGQFLTKSYTIATSQISGDGILDIGFTGTTAGGGIDVNGLEVGTPQQASPNSVKAGGAVSALTPEALLPLVAEAVARWTASGIDAAQVVLLRGAQFSVHNLGGAGYLGLAAGQTIWIDDDAAGYGWFVDATPTDDGEFGRQVASGEWQASALSPAFGRMDLLTVVMHELGHVIDQPDLNPLVAPHVLMTETLETGTRRVPAVFPPAVESTRPLSLVLPASARNAQFASGDLAFVEPFLLPTRTAGGGTSTRSPNSLLLENTLGTSLRGSSNGASLYELVLSQGRRSEGGGSILLGGAGCDIVISGADAQHQNPGGRDVLIGGFGHDSTANGPDAGLSLVSNARAGDQLRASHGGDSFDASVIDSFFGRFQEEAVL